MPSRGGEGEGEEEEHKLFVLTHSYNRPLFFTAFVQTVQPSRI